MGIADLLAPGISSRRQKCDVFKTSGTWTCPAGVTYAIAHLIGGGGGGIGGGSTTQTNPGAGGTSSALGGSAGGGTAGGTSMPLSASGVNGASGAANTAQGGQGGICLPPSGSITYRTNDGMNGASLFYGATVTPGTGYTVTVGDGGTAGTGTGTYTMTGGAGGSGLVEIWYEV